MTTNTNENTNVLAASLENLSDQRLTENGGIAYTVEAIGNRWVEVFYGVSSFRSRNSVRESLKARKERLSGETDKLVRTFVDALEASKSFTDKRYGIRLSLMIRDVIAGCGERALGRVLMTALADRNLVTAAKLIEVLGVKGYGRWDDLVYIASATREKTIAKAIREGLVRQLRLDIDAEAAGKPFSLLAKWMPSISTSSALTRKEALKFIALLEMDNKTYRKTLSRLRKSLDVVERKLCARQWSEIDYEKVPGQATLRYSRQFMAHDADRYNAYLDAAAKGEAKVNAKTLSAPEVMAKARATGFDAAGEMHWNALPKLSLKGNILPICDVSGSMLTSVASFQAIDASVGLSLYLAQSNKGPFEGLVMSFSGTPVLTDVRKYGTLKERVGALIRECGYNTDIEKVLELLWTYCKAKSVKQDDLPTLAFFSDMEFDAANRGDIPLETVFETYQRKFREIGLELPQVVFWNLCNRTGTVPVRKNDKGMVLCSGFSQHIMQAVFTGVYPTPWDMLQEQLDNARYAGILDEENGNDSKEN